MDIELSYPMLILMGCIPLFANWQKTAGFLPLQERNTVLRGDSTQKRIFGGRWSILMIHLRLCVSVFPRVILTIYNLCIALNPNVGLATFDVCLKP